MLNRTKSGFGGADRSAKSEESMSRRSRGLQGLAGPASLESVGTINRRAAEWGTPDASNFWGAPLFVRQSQARRQIFPA